VTTLGAAASFPWCCVVPALLASTGVASSLAGRILGALIPVFLALSVALFARAHHLLWVKGHGSPLARVTTVLLTIAATALWAHRLWPRW
jgi:hypothetical protein